MKACYKDFQMRWAKEHPEVMRMTAEYVRSFRNEPDPVVAVAQNAETLEGKIAWVLLGSCLYQEIPLSVFRPLLESLFQKYPGERLWTFPLPTEAEIRGVVRRQVRSYSWQLEESVPGIFWSVGSFVRRRRSLKEWLENSQIPDVWRSLGEIFFMGKRAFRPKALWALSRLYSPFPRGLGALREGAAVQTPVPFPYGLRSWIGIVGLGRDVGYAEMDEVGKRRLAASVCKELSPGDPREAAHAFLFFRESPSAEPFFLQLKNFCLSRGGMSR